MKSTKSRRKAQEAARKAQQQQQQRLLLIVGGVVVVVVVIAVALIAIRGNSGGTTSGSTTSGGSTSRASLLDDSTDTQQLKTSPCFDVKDPDTQVPAGGSAKQWTAPQQVVDTTHTYCAIIKTNRGRIVAEMYPKSAPKNVNNFVFLAQQGFYDGQTWHRVLPDFMAQTGDPTGTGAGGPGYDNIPLEIDPKLNYDTPGRIGVARTNDPNSAGSQFFITFQPYPSLSGQYTIIGQVVRGMNVVKGITLRDPEQNPTGPGDPLVSVRVVDLGAAKS